MKQYRELQRIKRIAIVGDDNKEADLIEWSYYNRHVLMQHDLTATGKSANILEGTVKKPVYKLLEESLGGYRQLGKMITEGLIDMIIFFCDSETPMSNNTRVKQLINIAITHNIIIAVNRPTADFLLSSVLMKDDYSIHVPHSSTTLANDQSIF
jgi:methylglyoxal synthase